jgi:hypothetical protein
MRQALGGEGQPQLAGALGDEPGRLRVQDERLPQRLGGGLPGVIVRGGADATDAEHDVSLPTLKGVVIAGKGPGQGGADAAAIVREVIDPRQGEAALCQDPAHAGKVPILPFSGQDLVADDDEADGHVALLGQKAFQGRALPSPPPCGGEETLGAARCVS